MSLLRFSENGTAYEPQLAELSWNYSIGRIAVSLVNSFKQQPWINKYEKEIPKTKKTDHNSNFNNDDDNDDDNNTNNNNKKNNQETTKKISRKITPRQQEEKAYFHRRIITALSTEHFLGALQLLITLL